ncbi:hypothetical protein IW261DRAFT_1551567 [Armillaria novae-zelandiae]|uniref:CxC1-like cysteine cluster associated with KDZ transposases domain-containing protein n=1 Tax=Armillaria novae-zelandiae TaxID=153914 RepID=A0AA39U793_9AGAR|nr:hypothetical protein IW261DRAFT_1551567 [Armillaria novae-zelandiae]
MEVFHAATLRCPQMSIQGFIRTLCDLHYTSVGGGLREQFSICYDVFLAILDGVESRVMRELSCTDPDWRLANCCAACTFELEGEEQLEFSMFGAMDGNDLLKRVPRSKTVDEMENEKVCIERPDSRNGGSGYILPRSEVDRWSKDAIGDVEVVNEETASPCKEHWKNMSDDCTSKMWGVFEETGFFLSLCRHRSVLIGADMVRSREQAKYPLAIVERLLKVFGEQLGIGYDIGCKFGRTINCSPLQELASTKKLCILVGLFHGHAHNRLCQLCNLGTYLTGLGLEDLETLEHFFSKSNALAAGVRYASRFHRRQQITCYLKHIDHCESFEHLSSFLCNNYWQALEIIESYPALKKSMHELGVADETEFGSWLREEEVYLLCLQKEPPEETLEMEYFAWLVQYYDIESKVAASQRVSFIMITAESHPQTRDDTRKMEMAWQHLLEKRSQELERVQDLEHTLGISPEERWTIGSDKWVENEQRVATRVYRQRLDQLEGLVISHIFELTKMNMSHTGYKMQKHIGKALKARSQAIRTALSQYNAAAAALNPPRPSLQWERVVEYAFLSDFDLLRDIRQDMSGRKWATPAGRKALDLYFKICQAKEEIRRLNIEIQRVITYMHEALTDSQPALALQVSLYRWSRERFYAMHMRRFYALLQDDRFSGSIEVGQVAGEHLGYGLQYQDVDMDIDSRHTVPPFCTDPDTDDSDDEEHEKTVSEEVEAILHISRDNGCE